MNRRGLGALALAALTAACGGEREPEAETPPPAPPPLAPIGDLLGFESKSRIVFHAAPEVPHRLEATYVFPQRVRWWRGVGESSSTSRVMDYRYGSNVYTIPDGTSASERVTGAKRDAKLRSFELRRALFLWPDGFDWHGSDTVRRCDLGGLGTLQARLGREGRLVELSSLDRDGVLLESFGLITWSGEGQRPFPASAEFSYRGEPIWSETVENVETRIRYRDDYFLPADRRTRAAQGPPAQPVGAAASTPLAPATLRSLRLPAEGDWAELVEAARDLHAREARRLEASGFEAEPGLVLEVDASGRPTHVQVRLSDPPAPPAAPPDGYEVRPAGHARVRFLTGPVELGRALFELGRAEPGGSGAAPWVRIQVTPEGAEQLVLFVPGFVPGPSRP